MPGVDNEIAKAKAEATRSRDATAAISAQRLAKLKRQSPRTAASYWQDPALTPEDQKNLMAWLRRQLPMSGFGLPKLSLSVPGIMTYLAKRPKRALVSMAILITLGFAAWNTWESVQVTITSDVRVAWMMGDQVIENQFLPAGTISPARAQTNDGNIILRGWWPKVGYVTALVPASITAPIR